MKDNINKKNIKKKSLKDMVLLDRFLFAEAVEDTVILKHILNIILDEDLMFISEYKIETEKEFRNHPAFRSIRLDVFVSGDGNGVYETEVQQRNTGNLPKRSRFYQSMIDRTLLEVGSENFNEMKNVVLIMIMPFDLFGEGRYRYSFQMSCLENPQMQLADGATRIFFNTHGEKQEGISEELIELLHYMEHTPEVWDYKSKRIREIQERVNKIKLNHVLEVKYMQWWEEIALEKAESKVEGQNRINELNIRLLQAGRTEDLLRSTEEAGYQEKLLEEFQL